MKFFLSDEQVKNVSKYGLFLINIIALGFIILIGLAIINYPGNYDFFTSYLSDLGQKMADGFDNSTSSLLFTTAMILAGILSALFWFLSQNVIYHSFDLPLKYKVPILIGSVIGFISTFFNALIGVFPLDTQQQNHYLVGAIFFSLAGLACTLYALFFIYIFFLDKKPDRVIEYSLASFLIPIIFALILTGFISQIPSYVIYILIAFLILLNLLFMVVFKSFITYLSYIVSFSMIVLEALIVMLIIGSGLKGIIEVTFIIGIVAFIMTNNIRLLKLEEKKEI
jgi:hypothetical protein